MASFDVLPPELLLLIFSELDGPGLAAASAACKTWEAFLESTTGEALWRRLARQQGFVSDAEATLPKGYRSWKHFFGTRYERERQWRKGSFDKGLSSGSSEWTLSAEQWGRVLQSRLECTC